MLISSFSNNTTHVPTVLKKIYHKVCHILYTALLCLCIQQQNFHLIFIWMEHAKNPSLFVLPGKLEKFRVFVWTLFCLVPCRSSSVVCVIIYSYIPGFVQYLHWHTREHVKNLEHINNVLIWNVNIFSNEDHRRRRPMSSEECYLLCLFLLCHRVGGPEDDENMFAQQ